MGCFLVIARTMVLGRFLVVTGCVLMMLSGFYMVVSGFRRHPRILSIQKSYVNCCANILT